jgi:deoxyadenosine/deoxycytidine kinase
LKASPEICSKRIKKRGRIEEETIELDYLKGLHDYHEKWLLNENISNNVIVIECDEEFETNKILQKQMIAKIKKQLDIIMFSKKINSSSNSNSNSILIEFTSDTKNNQKQQEENC